MARQVQVVFALTFVIHLVSMLSYSIRISGVRTGRIAVSLTFFNVLLLVSRTANTFQAPLLAKHVEQNILSGTRTGIEADFRWLLVSATLASIVGLALIPTFQRVFSKAIEALGSYRSMPRVMMRVFSLAAMRHARHSLVLPAKENITRMNLRHVPPSILVYNGLATAMLTVGVFASLFAGYLRPELRVTANSLSPIVNATSTILLFVFIDPYLSLLTDDVVAGHASEAHFRKSVMMLGSSRLVGTVLAQLVLIPGAKLIAVVADRL